MKPRKFIFLMLAVLLIAGLFPLTAMAEDQPAPSFAVTFLPGLHGSIATTGAPAMQNVESGKSATPPDITADPTWHFARWDKDYNKITASVEITAQYERDKMSLKLIPYPAEGGLLQHNIDGLYEYDSVVDLASAGPSANKGYDFTGWEEYIPGQTENTGSWKNIADSKVSIDASNVFRAVFALHKCNVTFVSGSYGTFDPSGAQAVQSVDYGKSATAPAVIPDAAHEFTGWDKTFNVITGDLAVTAKYAVKTFTVTFDTGDNGTFRTNGEPAIQVVNYGEAAKAPTVVPDDAYEFTGWDKSFDVITGDLTVTAQYAIKTFTVTFDTGDNGSFRTNGAPAVQYVEYGKDAIAPDVDADKGYAFSGWDSAFKNVTSDLYITAQYKLRRYKLTVHIDGEGTVSGIAGTYDYGTEVSLNDAVINPAEGYEFKEFVDAEGNLAGTVTMTKNRTVTAVFTKTAAPAPSPSSSVSATPVPSPSPVSTSTDVVTNTIPDSNVPLAAPPINRKASFSFFWLYFAIGIPLFIAILLIILLLKRRARQKN